MKKLDFEQISQWTYIIQKNGFIGFFYINDIVFIFKKHQANEVRKIVKLLLQALTITVVGDLK